MTPKEAAKRVGKSKATILRHIKDGKLSASRDDMRNYHIDVSELARVYGGDAGEPPHEAAHEAVRGGSHEAGEAPEKHPEAAILRVELEAAQKSLEDRERELLHRDRTIDDLRDRLDKEGEERRKLTAMLTDQRPNAAATVERSHRVWLAVGIGIAIGGAVALALTQFPIASV